MKTFGAVLLGLAVLAMTPLANATHTAGCVPTRADPASTIVIDLPNGQRFYQEERNSPFGTIPWTGFIFADGTWFYEETNTINAPEGSMQRGGIGLTGACFPPPPLPCLIIDEDPINDAECGHGPDLIIF